MTNSQRRKEAKKVERINRRFEILWLPRIQKTIQAKANVVISRLRSGGVRAALEYLTADVSNPALANQIKVLYRQVGTFHAKRVNDQLRAEPKNIKNLYGLIQLKRLGFNAEWAQLINDYLIRHLFDKITFKTNSTTRDALMRAITRGIDDGLGVDDIIRIMQEWPFARFQAARIVRTEVNRATNVGAIAGGSTFEFEQQKEWIAAKDSRTRGNPMNGQDDHANHWALDGSLIDENALFTDSRNGDQLRFPGDPNASAASTINCRCHVALVAKRDERGRLIPKQSRIAIIQPSQIRRPQIVTI